MTLADDLRAMAGVWHDHLTAWDAEGRPLAEDVHGGVPGPFPYDNLVYLDVDGGRVTQTNVTFGGRPAHARTFEADLEGDVLRFRTLGPDAPPHVGVTGGPGLIWFVAESLAAPGVQRYSEPDLIRLGDPDPLTGRPRRRWRSTALWHDGRLVRTMLATGVRLGDDTTTPHALDPRGSAAAVHGERSSTLQYRDEARSR